MVVRSTHGPCMDMDGPWVLYYIIWPSVTTSTSNTNSNSKLTTGCTTGTVHSMTHGYYSTVGTITRHGL